MTVDLELPELHSVGAGPNLPTVHLAAASAAQIEQAFSGRDDPPQVHQGAAGDAWLFTTERGVDGDYLIDAPPRGRFHLSASGETVLAWAEDFADPSWRRFLLDTVLGTATLVRGYEALHAAATVGSLGLVAIVANTGGGKSTLAVELMTRGETLFCDDILALSRDGRRVLAHPGPPLMNLTPSMANGTRADDLGRVLAVIDGDAWTMIQRGPIAARPLDAVIFLERRAGLEARARVLPQSPQPLLASSLRGGRDADRLSQRFELLGDLAQQARLVHVAAPPDLSPSALADLAIEALR
jgi:hypothetical protein